MNLKKVFDGLLKSYGSQGWWPIINNQTLLCEYHTGAPKNEAERFEICIGAILTQNSQWYPNVVRAIQQLKLGRPFTSEETEVIKKAEMSQGKVSEMPKMINKGKMLIQNTAWPNVEKVLQNLQKLNLIDAKRMLDAEETGLKNTIRPAGYYNVKAKKLRIFCEFFLKLGGRVPTREELLSVWGIGKETADSMLLYAFKVPTFLVDAYTKRCFSLLGFFSPSADYDEIKRLFEHKIKKDLIIYQEYHALIVEHAKRFYSKKPYGRECPLLELVRMKK